MGVADACLARLRILKSVCSENAIMGDQSLTNQLAELRITMVADPGLMKLDNILSMYCYVCAKQSLSPHT